MRLYIIQLIYADQKHLYAFANNYEGLRLKMHSLSKRTIFYYRDLIKSKFQIEEVETEQIPPLD